MVERGWSHQDSNLGPLLCERSALPTEPCDRSDLDKYYHSCDNKCRMYGKMRKGAIAILDALEPVVLAFAIFMMVYLFLFQPHKVDGRSMHPNLQDKEYVLTDKITYRRRSPERGEVIVFHAPPPYESDFIKRVVGLPGETVEINGGYVFINGKRLEEVYLPSSYVTNEKAFLREGVPYKIPQGYYIVFGDNRGFSSDSREWGPISEKAIVGRAWLVYWPASKWGVIQHEIYNL